jgi:hypothetical protein
MFVATRNAARTAIAVDLKRSLTAVFWQAIAVGGAGLADDPRIRFRTPVSGPRSFSARSGLSPAFRGGLSCAFARWHSVHVIFGEIARDDRHRRTPCDGEQASRLAEIGSGSRP